MYTVLFEFELKFKIKSFKVKEMKDSVTKTELRSVPEFLDKRVSYKGTAVNRIPEGYGVGIYSNYSLYKGEFKNGIPTGEGKGVYLLQKGSQVIYEGQWEHSEPNGQGLLRFPNGVEIHSEFKNGFFTAFCQIKLPNDDVFIGEISASQKIPQGFGLAEFKSEGLIYIGGWKNGRFDGKGAWRFIDSETDEGKLNGWFEGEFKGGRLVSQEPKLVRIDEDAAVTGAKKSFLAKEEASLKGWIHFSEVVSNFMRLEDAKDLKTKTRLDRIQNKFQPKL